MSHTQKLTQQTSYQKYILLRKFDLDSGMYK